MSVKRIIALLAKDLAGNILSLIALGGLLPFAFLMLWASEIASPDSITLLSIHQNFVWVFVPLTGVVLGNRLIINEYYGYTQLFLEALPIRRMDVLCVKYLLGLAILCFVSLCSLCFAALIASQSEPVGAWFFFLIALKTLVFVVCLWSLLFAMGLLGKLRALLYIVLFFVFSIVFESTALEPSRFGPFELVGDQFVLERSEMPTQAIIVTLGIAAFWIALAIALAFLNEGSVAESLAKRMSLREKATAGALVMAGFMAVTILEKDPEKDPFSFQQEQVLRSSDQQIEILYLRDDARDDAQKLLDGLEADLGPLQKLLGWKRKLPPLRISLHESLEPSAFEQVELSKTEGILMRANFLGSPQLKTLRAALIRELLIEQTDDRAVFEPRAWALDGFAEYWAHRDSRCAEVPSQCQPLLRALWATKKGITSGQLRRWWRFQEQHGEPIAQGVAFSGFLALEKHHGKQAVNAFARVLYQRMPRPDFREVIYARQNPVPTLFQNSTKIEWNRFLEEWNGELVKLRSIPEVAQKLSEIPQAQAEFEVSKGQGEIRNIVYTVKISPEQHDQSLSFWLLHRDLLAFDEKMKREDLRVENFEVPRLEAGGWQKRLEAGGRRLEVKANTPVYRGSEQRERRGSKTKAGATKERRHLKTLVGRYGPGTRVFLAIEFESETLACPVRLLAERREIR